MDDVKMVAVGQRLLRAFPDLMVLLLGLMSTFFAATWLWRRYASSKRAAAGNAKLVKFAIVAGALGLSVLLTLGFLLSFRRISALFPQEIIRPWESLVITWTLLSVPSAIFLGAVKLAALL